MLKQHSFLKFQKNQSKYLLDRAKEIYEELTDDSFTLKVDLSHKHPGKILCYSYRLKYPAGLIIFLQQTGNHPDNFQIGNHSFSDTGFLHLNSDFTSIRKAGLVNLRDGSRGHSLIAKLGLRK